MKKLVILCAAVASLTVASLADAGRVPNPGSDVIRINGFGTITYTERFFGGEMARVAIVGNGASDLDVFVYDSFGRLVAQGIGPTDIENVSWFVPGNQIQTFRIVVRNLGANANTYALATN